MVLCLDMVLVLTSLIFSFKIQKLLYML